MNEIRLGPDPDRKRPYFTIEGREISNDGGDVVYTELRSQEQLKAMGIDPDNPGTFTYEIVNGDGTPL